MTRTLPSMQLTHSPLVLVLCQVRIATVQDMGKYIPAMQERLRKQDFPVDVSREVVELDVQAEGLTRERRRAHWEFRSLQEDWSIIIGNSSAVVQTTSYRGFEEFLDILKLAMTAMDDVVGDLVVERVGLRYVNYIEPQQDESWKLYVKPGYRGQENDIIQPGSSVHFVQTVADTGSGQRMIVRLTQNRDGVLLPPDLIRHHPILQRQAEKGVLLTLIDLDHYREERQRFDNSKVIDIAWELHGGLEFMFRDMVTQHALGVWKQRHDT